MVENHVATTENIACQIDSRRGPVCHRMVTVVSCSAGDPQNEFPCAEVALGAGPGIPTVSGSRLCAEAPCAARVPEAPPPGPRRTYAIPTAIAPRRSVESRAVV